MALAEALGLRDFPTERVLSRTPLIIRTVDQNQKEKNNLTLDHSHAVVAVGAAVGAREGTAVGAGVGS